MTNDRVRATAELAEVERLLDESPPDRLLERSGLESRRDELTAQLGEPLRMTTTDDERFERACLRAVRRDAVTIDRLRFEADRLRRELASLERALAAKDETIATLMRSQGEG